MKKLFYWIRRDDESQFDTNIRIIEVNLLIATVFVYITIGILIINAFLSLK